MVQTTDETSLILRHNLRQSKVGLSNKMAPNKSSRIFSVSKNWQQHLSLHDYVLINIATVNNAFDQYKQYGYLCEYKYLFHEHVAQYFHQTFLQLRMPQDFQRHKETFYSETQHQQQTWFVQVSQTIILKLQRLFIFFPHKMLRILSKVNCEGTILVQNTQAYAYDIQIS